MLYQQTIPASGVLQMTLTGRLFLLDSTGAAASADVSLLRSGSPFFTAPGMKRGLRLLTQAPFDGVSVTAAAGTVVRFIVADEDVQISTTDGVIIANAAGNPVPVDLTAPVTLVATDVGVLSPNTLAGVADVSVGAGAAVQIVAADATHKEREVIIKNLFANAAAMRIAGSTAAAALGHELAPGESITLNTTAAVYAYNAGAAGQSVSVLVNTRV